ncbi:MAG: hypothetical protein K1X75_01110 [Leptospirales bacterium]|nr:hypothetical protein [Leptospirales bacterium]
MLFLLIVLRRRLGLLVFIGVCAALPSACLDTVYDLDDSGDAALETRGKALRRISVAYTLRLSQCGLANNSELSLFPLILEGDCSARDDDLLRSCEQRREYVGSRAVDDCIVALILTPCSSKTTAGSAAQSAFLPALIICSSAVDGELP